MTDKDAKPKRLKIKAAGTMKRIMAEHFQGLDAAAQDPGKRVAWCTSVGPAELLRSFGFDVYFPENHAAILGAQRTAMDYIPLANAAGYSPEICSYLTSDVGAYLRRETPLTKAYGLQGIPRPDVLVYNTNQCRDVQEWFSWWGRELQKPVLGITPPRSVGEVTPEIIADVAHQMKALRQPLEEISGQKFDADRLRETLGLSLEATLLWEDCLNLGRTVPSPLTFFDATIHMGPIVVLRGLPAAVAYYRELKAEMEERVADRVAAVPDETYRLYWEGMPIWGKLRGLSELFLGLKACIVASTYCNSWVFSDFDADHPWESMALAYTKIFIVRDEKVKMEYITRLHQEFRFDGIVFHDAKTCPNNSNTRYGMPQRLRDLHGIPFLIVHGDLNDLRCYSEEQAVTNIEAFIEQLAGAARTG
jgi:benzoyl-CoA reductase/2-hydroxyglutaryl-CoA dehydratase subunit BcrC/BadD/HgdB